MNRKNGKIIDPRWSLDHAAHCWGVDHKALKASMRKNGIEEGEDGRYSTRDIDRAIHDDIEAEKLRDIRERATKNWLDNQRVKAELIERGRVITFCTNLIANLTQKILASSLEDVEKDELLLDIKKLEDSEWVKQADQPLVE